MDFSDNESNKSELVEELTSNTKIETESKRPPFLHFTPVDIEFTNLFPEFPKSHEMGFATVVELPKTIQSEENVMDLLKSMQYSRSNQGGGGIRIKDNIEFFAKVGENGEKERVAMGYHTRQCAGVKTCEHFPLTSHTEVNAITNEWPQRLAEQERMASNSKLERVLALHSEMQNERCDRPMLGGLSFGNWI